MPHRITYRAIQSIRQFIHCPQTGAYLGPGPFAACVFVGVLVLTVAPIRAEIPGIPEANVAGFGCVDMESDYVPRVLTCENGLASFEALKAQAVAARTYGYYQLLSGGEIGDGQGDQVYSCSFQPQAIHFQAAVDTSCEILTYSQPITDVFGVISSFYVAGALTTYNGIPPFFMDIVSDPTNTERFVTYNYMLTSDGITQTPLGFTTPDPLDFTANRGCMSQNGADTLSDNGWDYRDILRFYYGEDIEFTIIDNCTNGPQLVGCLPPDCNSNGIDDAEDIANQTSDDCNDTGIPDECELDDNDCDLNGVPDECDFARAVVFEEDFDSPANWTVLSAGGDFTAEDSFDYSVHGIPAAPNSSGGTTRGLKFTVNSNDAIPAIDAVSAFPPGISFGGNYRLEFDMWMNYNGGNGGFGGAGTTEFATFGVNLQNGEVIWTNTVDSNGLWFAISGEGGATQDYRAYRAGQLLSASEGGFEADSLNASATYYHWLFPGTAFETPGSPGKNWVHVETDITDGVIGWIMDRTLIASRFDDSADTGSIMLGYMDVFSSISGPAEDNFVIYDNVRVTVLDDCNSNGVTDGCDIATETVEDCNENGVPDECESDLDLATDCNNNSIPDLCELLSGVEEDCDNNGTLDECDIAAGTAVDCNNNDTPDTCDIAVQSSEDCDENGVPDECDADCDQNGVVDACEIAAGTTPDCAADNPPADADGDGVPDSQDQCPQTPTDQTVDTNGCPADQTDADGDTPAGQDVPDFSRNDADGDGVIDAFDLCPDTPEGASQIDADGCELEGGGSGAEGEGVGNPLDTSAQCGDTGCGAFGAISMSAMFGGLARMRRRRWSTARRPI